MGVVQGDNRLVVVYTGHIGAMYDPNAIPEALVPRSIKDLGDARYRGKLMLYNYAQSYLAYAHRLGREATFGALRAAVRGGAPADTYANGYTRFAAKEYPILMTSSSYYLRALGAGVPAKLRAGSVNAGFTPSVIQSIRLLFAVASAGVPPTNCTIAGDAAMANPPSPLVSVMAESPRSAAASSTV